MTLEDSTPKKSNKKPKHPEQLHLNPVTPKNRSSHFFGKDKSKYPNSLEELTLVMSPVNAEKILNQKTTSFTTASALYSDNKTSPTSPEVDLTPSKTNLSKYIASKSQKKTTGNGQAYVDHRKWLEETLKSKVESGVSDEHKSNKQNKTPKYSPRREYWSPKLEPLNQFRTVQNLETKPSEKTWEGSLYQRKNNKHEDSSQIILKLKENKQKKKALTYLNQLNEATNVSIQLEAKTTSLGSQEPKKDKKFKLINFLRNASSPSVPQINPIGLYHGPSPMIKSLVISHKKVE